MLLLCPRMLILEAGVPGISQKSHKCPCNTPLSPATSTAAGRVGRELEQHPPHPTQTHLPSHPNKEPQSHHKPWAKGCHNATAVLSLYSSSCSQKPMAGHQSLVLSMMALQGEKSSRESTERVCAEVRCNSVLLELPQNGI